MKKEQQKQLRGGFTVEPIMKPKAESEKRPLFEDEEDDESVHDASSLEIGSDDGGEGRDFDDGSLDEEQDEQDEPFSSEEEQDDSVRSNPKKSSSGMILSAGDEAVATVRDRITSTVRLLDNFAQFRAEQGDGVAEPRSFYHQRLLSDAATYYGYSEYMIEKLSQLFSAGELVEFLEANETARPVTIRTNTLKTRRRELAQALINRGATVEPVGKWSTIGLQVFESPVPIGATPEYLAGQYIIQSASSMLPVAALGAQPNERILDMSAAPGGKTTHIAADMQNTGCLFANDPNPDRCRALAANVHRLGVRNTIISSYDGRQFPGVISGFDRVLLDAPCSGTGVITKDPTVKTSKTAEDFTKLTHLQKELILAAIDSCQHNAKHQGKAEDVEAAQSGVIVYSTCSITVEENEEVINYALAKRPNVRLVSTGLPFGKEGFVSFRGHHLHPSIKLTRRFYPHAHNMDGFFVAKLVKFAPSPPKPEKRATEEQPHEKTSKQK